MTDQERPTPAAAPSEEPEHAATIGRLALGLVFVPFLVAVVVLIFDVGSSYLPMSDHALTEMHIRDIGHHPVLIGLYSRDDWSHPGPMLFYALAPFYWLTGGASIALNLGALAINGGSVAGIAIVARRRGGTTLMVWTLLACSLLIRTLGADFIRDPWNNYVVTFPFALLIFLVWAMACGELWALPVGVVVASFLAQTHVGFVVLAVPMFTFGAVWLAVSMFRSKDAEAPRRIARVGGLSLVLGAVLWLPTVIDAAVNRPSNATRILRYFRNPDAGIHTLGEGWRVVSAQFAAAPEWLTSHRTSLFGGQSAFLHDAPLPVLLVLVLVAGAGYWQMTRRDGLRLIAALTVTFVLGVIAVDRTIGAAFDYRLRWTWAVGMAGSVAVVWCVLLGLERWRPSLTRRVLPIVGLAGLVACTTVNVVTATRAGVPQQDDVKVLAALMPSVLDDLEHDAASKHGQVIVDDGPFQQAAWYSRSLVLQLERHGYDARMPPPRGIFLADHREEDGRPVAVRLVVASDREIETRDADATLHRLAKWSSLTSEDERDYDREATALDRDYAEGLLSGQDHLVKLQQIDPSTIDPAVAWAVAVYRVDTPS
jgi:hypothetical protein